jgi:hypothetical protein
MKMDAMTVEFIPGGVIASVGVLRVVLGNVRFFCGVFVVKVWWI